MLHYLTSLHIPAFVVVLMAYALFVVAEDGGNIWMSEWTEDKIVNGTRNATSSYFRLIIYGGIGALEGTYLSIFKIPI